MKMIATFDIGTTAIKAVLMSELGKPVFTQSRTLDTHHRGPNGTYMEQDPKQWVGEFYKISQQLVQQCPPHEIAAIVMSGQMQDLILLNAQGDAVMDAILYSDGRAEAEAQEIANAIGMDVLRHETGNMFEGSRPFAKLLWVKRHRPDVYREAVQVLISAKDYVCTQLTGAFASDVTSCSTAGLMAIETKQWHTDWLKTMELTHVMWPRICQAHEQVGVVQAKAAKLSGFSAGTPVYAGAGDAGSTTLASGIARDGEFNINLGTSGWVACTADQVLRESGVSNLVAMPRQMYINVVPFFNAGNVHRWAVNAFAQGNDELERYINFNDLLSQTQAGSGGLLFLPYLVGERFPVMDSDIAGCYIDVRPSTGKAEMARAALEGVAYSIRQGMDAIGKQPVRCSLVGGGTRVGEWCQILADMLHLPLQVYRDAQYLPAMALAASVLIAQGKIPDYYAFTDTLQTSEHCQTYQPDTEKSAVYDHYYQRYCTI